MSKPLHKSQPESRSPQPWTDWDYEYDDDLCSHDACNTCAGEGWIVTCIDDMCRGAGECMHGDGNTPCPDCDNY